MSVQYLLLLLYVGDGSRQKQRLSQCASAEFLAFGKSKEELSVSAEKQQASLKYLTLFPGLLPLPPKHARFSLKARARSTPSRNSEELFPASYPNSSRLSLRHTSIRISIRSSKGPPIRF